MVVGAHTVQQREGKRGEEEEWLAAVEWRNVII